MISLSLIATSLILVLRSLSRGDAESSDIVTTSGRINGEDGGVTVVDGEVLGVVHVSDGRYDMLECLAAVS